MTESAAPQPAPEPTPLEQPSPDKTRNRRIVLTLIVLTLACYWPVGKFEFNNYDDPRYVPRNEVVRKGLTWEGIKYAFTSNEVGYRHPLPWISHLIDVSLFGLNGGGHHVTSLIFHTINVVLLWWVLMRLTGAVWPSAWVAAILAVHPTHLESVAWVAERKDTISLMFLLLTIWAYAAYAERPSVGRYLLVMLGFIAALLSKPMMVTTPALLLLLDVWPLRRIRLGGGFGKSLVRPVLEKLPLLAFSAFATFLTIQDTAQLKTLLPLDQYPLPFRIETSLVGYVRYLGKLVWPTNLSVFYPYPDKWPLVQVVLSTIALIIITALVIWQARRRPYLLVGWLFFTIAISPVIGMIPSGEASLGDRYTYAPYIGLCIALAWLARDLGKKYGLQKLVIGLAAGTTVACAALTAVGVWRWQNSLTLMGHAIRVTENNWMALNNYGVALKDSGKPEEACSYFAQSLRYNPNSSNARRNYASCLIVHGELKEAAPLVLASIEAEPDNASTWVVAGQYAAAVGQHAKAIEYFQKSLAIEPISNDAHRLMAYSLFNLGRIDEGEKHLRIALELNPNLADVRHRLGLIAIQRGKADEAIEEFQAALQINPNLGVAYLDYGILLHRLGRLEEALPQLQKSVETLPSKELAGRSLAEINMGKIMEKLGRPMDGAQHFLNAINYGEQGVAARPGDPTTHYQLASTLRDLGRHDQALLAARKSLELARQMNNRYLIGQLTARFPELAPTTQPATAPATQTTP